MVFQQLSFNLQVEQNKEDMANTNLPQTIKKDTSKNHQNTVSSCKFTSLKKIKNSNYTLTAEKHIMHSKENNSSNLTKKPNDSKDELEKVIEELREAEKECKKAERIFWETINELLPENLRKNLDEIS